MECVIPQKASKTNCVRDIPSGKVCAKLENLITDGIKGRKRGERIKILHRFFIKHGKIKAFNVFKGEP